MAQAGVEIGGPQPGPRGAGQGMKEHELGPGVLAVAVPRRGRSRGCARPRSSWRRGRRCRGSAPGPRRSPPGARRDRSAPASPSPDGARTARARASRGCAHRRGGSGSARCWSPGEDGRTGGCGPSRSSGRARRTSAPAPRTPPAPAIALDDGRHSARSRPSPAPRRDSGAPASSPGSGPRPPPPRYRRPPPKEPPRLPRPRGCLAALISSCGEEVQYCRQLVVRPGESSKHKSALRGILERLPSWCYIGHGRTFGREVSGPEAMNIPR